MDQEIERSFSQVLARGKYVHSIVFHSVKLDKVDEYVDLVGGWYPRVAKMQENQVNLVGSWRTEVGDCDTFGMGSQGICLSSACTNVYCSSHLGISALSRLPQLPALDPRPSRVRRLRQKAQEHDNPQANLPDARILLLASYSPSSTWRSLRTPLIYPPSG